MSENPMFTDPDNFDYSLLPNSPCLGVGRYGDDLGAIPSGITSIDEFEIVPEKLSLISNYPNPFNASTSIGLTLPDAGYFDISITNILGQYVHTLYNGYLKRPLGVFEPSKIGV